MLDVENLSLYYDGALALDDVSFKVTEREVVAIIGPNGAGKTSLLRAISRLHPSQGAITFGDHDMSHLEAEQVVKRGLIHCPQSAQLFPDLTVLENLQLGAYLRGRDRAKQTLARVYALFPRLHERQSQRASTLSGGERQMVAIGRSLMGQPSLLMLDEPTLGLAPVIRETIEQSLKAIVREWGLTVLLVEQDTAFALSLADRTYILDSGQVVFEGTAAQITANSALREAYLGL